MKIEKRISLWIACILALSLCGCSYVQKRLDISGLDDLAADIAPDADTCRPEKLRQFADRLSLEQDTKPVDGLPMTIAPLSKWPFSLPSDARLIMEKITFPSLIKHADGTDTAAFYVYRTGELRDQKIILWIPGAGVSDLAFHFIKHFFIEGLQRNYRIVFYVPPYHMERAEPGRENGTGLFTSDPSKNISVLLNSVRELRTMIAYLKSQGVKEIGGWGESIGATILLLTDQTEILDHLNMMIPVVDLEAVVLHNDHMRDVVGQFEKAGFSADLLAPAYGIVNPMHYRLKVDPMKPLWTGQKK